MLLRFFLHIPATMVVSAGRKEWAYLSHLYHNHALGVDPIGILADCPACLNLDKLYKDHYICVGIFATNFTKSSNLFIEESVSAQ